MDIDVLYHFDSQIKVFQILQETLSMHDIKGICIDDRASLLNYVKNASHPNLIITTLGAADTVSFVNVLKNHYNKMKILERPYIISMPVGITFDRVFFSTFMQRSVADVVLVNNKKSLQKMVSYSSILGIENKFVACLPVIFDKYSIQEVKNKEIKCVLFIVQNDIPKSQKEREYVCHKLVEYAKRFPLRTIIVKPRNRINEPGAHQQKYSFEELFYKNYKNKLPSNIIISYEPIIDLIPFCDIGISFSSSAILEVLIAGKQAGIISDLGVGESNGTSYFIKSNLIIDFEDLFNDNIPEVSDEWLYDEFDAPYIETVINSLMPEIVSANAGALPFSSEFKRETYQDYVTPNIFSKYDEIIHLFKKKKKRDSYFIRQLKKLMRIVK